MKKFMDEFKEFIAQGNVMDMAVGIIIGGAFTAIVTALTEDIINPLITLITGGGVDSVGALNIAGMDFGAFISAILNFLIIAFVVFWLVKSVNKLQKLAGMEKPAEAPAPTCPHCLEEVKEGATRCPHCGGEI
ncbi:large conductance mechanosensitive channel protein MscL [Slackia heliotrinireducens]|jgi:large conductance mechanosensitive channel|uniref:Large-conductance mechanosensitive channel n=1 Tax=Slackia heliotrinireducens (strain ATCC 29202 / DSM 20476 / NCTC 11029 / RHS 1) TaxID=471855 RepID=C7N534_SLAHD|nr:large conductance mechanosensitive channel protein MscL [Slackia heliotrinireducens]ACV22019.1 large conductance mechanosensitive channel protein [Slackia heliotrinireducens DSM 20476]VEG99941.1 Large-conductance mechanosensitive channel [Slackia heliotrinireducens]